MRKFIADVYLVASLLAVGLFFRYGLLAGMQVIDTYILHDNEYVEQKVIDRASYDTRKEVEDTARTMLSYYESDKSIYEQYKDADTQEEMSWSEQAKMRANETASSFNQYLFENSSVFEGNVPEDIRTELFILE